MSKKFTEEIKIASRNPLTAKTHFLSLTWRTGTQSIRIKGESKRLYVGTGKKLEHNVNICKTENVVSQVKPQGKVCLIHDNATYIQKIISCHKNFIVNGRFAFKVLWGQSK